MQQKNFNLEFAGRTFNTWYVTELGIAEVIVEKLLAEDRGALGLDLETYAKPNYINNPNAPLEPLLSLPRTVQICDGYNIIVFDLMLIGMKAFLFELLTTKKFVAHNAMFEIQHLLCNFNIAKPDVGCTKIATRLMYDAIHPNSAAFAADLASVCKELLKIDLPKDIDHTCWGNPDLTYEQVCYAALDAPATLLLAEKLTQGLKNFNLLKIYNLYKRAQLPLAKMQLNGIKINQDAHWQCIADWKVEAATAKKELLKITGLKDTNPKSMIQYLEDTLPPEVLAIWPLTEGGEDEDGELSLSSDTFSDFSYLPIVEPFSRFKKATKLSSTYGTKLSARISKADDRIHCNYNLCGTRTGRLSSSNPNLQQLPREKRTRSLFVAPKGRRFVVADFNQIELRVAAEFSRDPEMLRAYAQGRDLHAVTAEMLSGRKLADMTKEEAKIARQSAKALNFGLLFGLGCKKFRHYAHKNYGAEMTEDQAYASVSAWHELYGGYSDWFTQISSECRETMQIRTATGKLRALSAENYYGASANTPVQGSASEAMLYSLIKLEPLLGVGDKLLNTVHDEIMIETADTPVDDARVKALLEQSMISGFKEVFKNASVLNLVEIKSGFNWAECK